MTMSKIYQLKSVSQNKIMKLFQKISHYCYLGNWEECLNNSNITTNQNQKMIIIYY